MDKLQNAINVFGLENGQYSILDIKQIFRKLASVNHPDKGGNTETMQIINTAFSELCKHFEMNQTLDVNFEEASENINFSFIQNLKNMQGVIIEVCGYWVWLTGNTFAFKDEIKSFGFKFSGSKKAWYWSPTVNLSNGRRGSKSLSKIRKEFGSQVIKNEQQQFLN